MGRCSIALVAAVLACSMRVQGATLHWNPTLSPTGPTDGSGRWDDSDAAWWDGAANRAWIDTNADLAVFGAASGPAGIVTVTLERAVGGLTFNAPASGTYTLTGGTIRLTGPASVTANVNATISAVLAGEVLTKAGAAALTLTGSNTFTGPLVVQAGTLIFGTVAPQGAGPSSLGLPTGPAEGTLGLESGAALLFRGATAQQTDRPILLRGTGTTWTLSNLDSSGGAGITYAGSISGRVAGAAGQRTLNLVANNWASCPVIVSGVIADPSPSNSLRVHCVGGGGTGYNTGAARLLSPSNTFSGPVTTTYGCYLQVTRLGLRGEPSSLGTGLSNNTVTVGASGSAYAADMSYVGSAPATTDRQVLFGGGPAVLANNSPAHAPLRFIGTNSWTGGANVTLGGTAVATNEIAAPIFLSGNLYIGTDGAWLLSGSNTFQRPIFISKGDLVIGGGGVLGGGWFTNTITLTSNALVFASTATQTVAGPISGPGALRVEGPGRLRLVGTNSAAGRVTAAGGALICDGTWGTGVVTVASTLATLGGGGVLAGPLVNHGTVAPGADASLPATLSAGSFTQSNAGVLSVELAAADAGDQLRVSGPARLDGTVQVTLAAGFEPAAADQFTILTAGDLAGTFAVSNLPPLAGGLGWEVDYSTTQVALRVVNLAPAGYDAWAAGITNGLTNDTDSATGDGYPNLLKYATGSSATEADHLARLTATRSGAVYRLRFNRNPDATDVTLFVERTAQLGAGANWEGVATNRNGSWGGAVQVSESGGPTPLQVVVEDDIPATNRWHRLRVTRP